MCELRHRIDEILPRVHDCRVTAVGAGDCGLLLGSNRADDGRAKVFCPLAENETDTPRSGVKEDGVAALDRKGREYQVMRGDPLGKDSRR